MKHCTYYILTLLACVCGGTGYAQPAAGSAGTDFWFAFGVNAYSYMDDSLSLQVRVAAVEGAATGTIYFTALGETHTFAVDSGQVYTYSLTNRQERAVYCWPDDSLHTAHLTTSAPVQVYALNQRRASADATGILPVTALGTDYYILSYPSTMPYNYMEDSYAVIAAADSTQLFQNGTFVDILDRGEVCYRLSGADLTGTHITADKPVALFAMNISAFIPRYVAAADILFEQLPPVHTWGRRFFVPVSHLGKDRVRIIASQDNTTIRQSGGVGVVDSERWNQLVETEVPSDSITLHAGEFIELRVTADSGGAYIEADRPVGVCAYLTGMYYQGKGVSDPAQAWVPPIEQKVTTAAMAPFIPAGVTWLTEHFALLITATVTRDSTTMRIGAGAEQPLQGGTWHHHPKAGMSFYALPLTDPLALCRFTNRPAGLAVMSYGTGRYESYYYLASSAMRDLLATAFSVDGIPSGDLAAATICAAPAHTFRAEVQGTLSTAPGHLQWYFNGTENPAFRDSTTFTTDLAAGTCHVQLKALSADGVADSVAADFTVTGHHAIDVSSAETCAGEQAVLHIGNPESGADYAWHRAADHTLLHTGTTFTTPALARSTTYTVQMIGVACPPPDTTAAVTVHPLPAFEASADSVCYGELPVLHVGQPDPAHRYEVYGNAALQPPALLVDGASAAHILLDEALTRDTIYYIRAVTPAGCHAVRPAPVAVVPPMTLSPDSLPPPAGGVLYSRQLTAGGSEATYALIGGSLPYGLALTTDGLLHGTLERSGITRRHDIIIEATDGYGCTAVRQYTLAAGAFFVPEVFTPNGDGTNDHFMKGYRVIIFDRLGIRLFEGTDGWNGTHHGRPAPPDTYYYILHAGEELLGGAVVVVN